MLGHYRSLCAFGMALALCEPGGAQVAETPVARTEAVFTEDERTLAERWRLSVEEWGEYRTLMRGPRGIWTPNLDPLTVLGIHAESEAERRRYAELLVMIEYERVERELRFQQAYDEAAARLFPTLPRVSPASTDVPPAFEGADRLAFVGSVDAARCPACADRLKRWLGREARRAGPVLDLYLADAADDAALRAWAAEQGVTPALVRRGRITVNHARGSLAEAAPGASLTPRWLERIAGQWRSVSVER